MAIPGAAGLAWRASDPGGETWALAASRVPHYAIGGGTDEIQRNIIGERVLRLRPEPRVERTVSFDQVLAEAGLTLPVQ